MLEETPESPSEMKMGGTSRIVGLGIAAIATAVAGTVIAPAITTALGTVTIPVTVPGVDLAAA
jgi:hypothetical protein